MTSPPNLKNKNKNREKSENLFLNFHQKTQQKHVSMFNVCNVSIILVPEEEEEEET
jgi:hypothetical protein